MKRLLLPLVLLILGIGAGVGAGIALKPANDEMAEANPCGDIIADATSASAEEESAEAEAEASPEREYAKMNNQFIVPVVKEGRVEAMVVMALNLELLINTRQAVFATEPKLRDEFLQAMFDHANNGGFSGNFTSGENMRALRNNLLRRAQSVVGNDITDVLITDIMRQDS